MTINILLSRDYGKNKFLTSVDASMSLINIIYNVIIGMSLAAIPGPIFLEVSRRAVTRGWAAGAAVGLGEFFATLIILPAAYFGASLARQAEALYFAGACVSVYIGIKALRQRDILMNGRPIHGGACAGFLLALSSPLAWTTWLTIGSAAIIEHNGADAVAHMLALGIGVLVFFSMLALMIARTREMFTEQWMLRISRFFGVCLIGYGLFFLVKGLVTVM